MYSDDDHDVQHAGSGDASGAIKRSIADGADDHVVLAVIEVNTQDDTQLPEFGCPLKRVRCQPNDSDSGSFGAATAQADRGGFVDIPISQLVPQRGFVLQRGFLDIPISELVHDTAVTEIDSDSDGECEADEPCTGGQAIADMVTDNGGQAIADMQTEPINDTLLNLWELGPDVEKKVYSIAV